MATDTAFDIIRQGLPAALSPLHTYSEGLVRNALLENSRRYQETQELRRRSQQLADIASQRTYEEARDIRQLGERRADIAETREFETEREKRQRGERKEDIAAEDLRKAQNELAGFGGDPRGKDITQLNKEIAELKRAKQVQFATEDRTRNFEASLTELATKSEREKRDRAEQYGIAGARDVNVPIGQLERDIANYEADEKERQRRRQIDNLRTTPAYQGIRNRLADAVAQRTGAIERTVVPAPTFHPDLSDAERIGIYNAIADLPAIKVVLSKTPEAEKAIRNGDLNGLELLSRKDRKNIELAMETAYTKISDQVRKMKGFEASLALQNYSKQLTNLDDVLRSADQQIRDFYSHPVYGPALFEEDPKAISQLGEQRLGGGAPTGEEFMPSWMGPPVSRRPASAPVAPGATAAPVLPPAGYTAPAAPGAAVDPRAVKGLFPWVGEKAGVVSSAVPAVFGGPRGIFPTTGEGVGEIAQAVSDVGDIFGTGYQTARTYLLGGVPPPQTVDPLSVLVSGATGVAKAGTGLFEPIGTGLETLGLAIGGDVEQERRARELDAQLRLMNEARNYGPMMTLAP